MEQYKCPEKKQAFGKRAKQFTSDMVFGKIVEVKPVNDVLISIDGTFSKTDEIYFGQE